MTEDQDLTSVTLDEVAQALKVHYNTVYRRVIKGEIPAFKVGHQWRVRKKALLEYMARTGKQSSR
jgi:excisionase family DNA binding protein